MNKYEYFLGAHKAGNFTKRAWVLESFAVVQHAPEHNKELKPYWIHQTPTGYYTKQEAGGELIRISDCKPGEPPLTFDDTFLAPAGSLPTLAQDTWTLIGNFYFNAVVLVRTIATAIAYQDDEIDIAKLENAILAKVKDDPLPGEPASAEEAIYIKDYLKFKQATFFLTEFAQLCVWSTTAKVITPPPGVKEFRAKLLEENKDRLNDPVVIANINKQLQAFDDEYLKGDPGGEKFLSSGKSRTVVRQRRYLMLGAETSLKDEIEVTPITKSLSEGWDLEKFPIMMDSLRAGSFNRGAQTEKGGEAVKWLFRASANVNMGAEDCGSPIGRPVDVTDKNVESLVGFSVVTGKEPEYIESKEQAGKYLGKSIMMRSTMYCKMDATDYCKTCLGTLLSSNPTGISLNVSEYGSIMLGIFMSAAHATALVTADLVVDEAFS